MSVEVFVGCVLFQAGFEGGGDRHTWQKHLDGNLSCLGRSHDRATPQTLKRPPLPCSVPSVTLIS
jgi:hypothetical protein